MPKQISKHAQDIVDWASQQLLKKWGREAEAAQKAREPKSVAAGIWPHLKSEHDKPREGGR